MFDRALDDKYLECCGREFTVDGIDALPRKVPVT